MKINTKFNITDKVFVLSNNTVKEGFVTEINCKCGNNNINITYSVSLSPSLSCTREEDYVFTSKKELLESL